jgi:tetratricopeptide (TPR) repeat protein
VDVEINARDKIRDIHWQGKILMTGNPGKRFVHVPTIRVPTIRHFITALVVVTTVMLIGQRASLAGESASNPDTLYLNASMQPFQQPQAVTGYLEREFARQAVLLAARDMGCATRDMVLREPFPQELKAGEVVLDIEVFRDPAQKKQWFVLSDKAKAHKTIESAYTPGDLGGLAEYEELAGTRLPAALKALGLAETTIRPALKTDAAAPVPKEIEELLGNLSPFNQFAAIRRLHGLVRESGESPARLGALARGYANLSNQAENLFVAMRKVYLARAYLYAQRLIRLQDAANAHRNLAYVCAMHGNNARVLEEFDQAAKMDEALAREGRPVPPAPPWQPLIEHYAKSRFDELAKDAEKAGADRATCELAMYLRCDSLLSASTDIALAGAEEACKLNPENVRIVCVQCCIKGVSHLHGHTLLGFKLMAKGLSRCASLFPELPAPAKTALTGGGSSIDGLARAAKVLVEAGGAETDCGEPSLAALGRLAQEINFAFVRYRLNFMRNSWSVPTEDTARQFLPLVEDHPFKGFVLAMSQKQPDSAACLNEIHWVDPSHQAAFMLRDIRKLCKPTEQLLGVWKAAAQRDLSPSIWDLVQSFLVLDLRQQQEFNQAREHCRELLKVDPQGVSGPTWLLNHFPDDQAVAANVKKWEEQFAFHPAVQRALALYYEKRKQVGKAQEYWLKCLAAGPEPEACRHLAKAYLDMGDETKWLATLKEILKQPDTGLTHASTGVQIARHYMEKNDYITALPYAEEAAQSWAQWAMQCAAECYEGLGNYDRAAEWWGNISERYEHNEGSLYCFWLRTQHGDAAAARRLAEKQDNKFFQIAFNICEGKPDKAQTIFQKYVDDKQGKTHISHFILLALIADEAKDAKTRNEFLQRAASEKLDLADKTMAPLQLLALLMQTTLAKNENTSLDETEMSKLKRFMPKQDWLGLLAARFEMLHGSKDKAKEYLTSSFSVNSFYKSESTCGMLTAFWGRGLGLDLMTLAKEAREAKGAQNTAPSNDDF